MKPMAFDPTWPGPQAATDPPASRCDERLAPPAVVRADEALTLDEMSFSVEAVISWRIHDTPAVADAMTKALATLLCMGQECLRACIGRFSIVVLLDERATIEQAVERRLCAALERAAVHPGVSIRAVSIAWVAIPAASRARFEACALQAIDACRRRRSMPPARPPSRSFERGPD